MPKINQTGQFEHYLIHFNCNEMLSMNTTTL